MIQECAILEKPGAALGRADARTRRRPHSCTTARRKRVQRPPGAGFSTPLPGFDVRVAHGHFGSSFGETV